MALLLKSGKQILRLSSSLSLSSASVAAKSQKGLGGVTAAASFTRSLYMVPDSPFYPNQRQHKQDDDFEIPPPKTLKSFFTNMFRAPPPPSRTPFQELLGKFMDLAERSKHCSEDEDGLSRILDDIRPVLTELLYRMTDKSIVRFVYEFARPAASSPPVVIDRKIKAMVDQLPSHVIHLFIDLMLRQFWERYGFRSKYDLKFPSNSTSVVLTADVSHIGKEHLKLFMVEDNLMVTGLDKDAPPGASAQLLALYETVHNALLMPSWPYSRDEISASIFKDQEQGISQLKIVVPIHDETEVVAPKPRVFQLNLDTKGAHQG